MVKLTVPTLLIMASIAVGASTAGAATAGASARVDKIFTNGTATGTIQLGIEGQSPVTTTFSTSSMKASTTVDGLGSATTGSDNQTVKFGYSPDPVTFNPTCLSVLGSTAIYWGIITSASGVNSPILWEVHDNGKADSARAMVFNAGVPPGALTTAAASGSGNCAQSDALLLTNAGLALSPVSGFKVSDGV